MLTLRMGNSPGESHVNAGPAVYISPSGPNPIMVQPFPLQASSLFGGSAAVPSMGISGPVGIGTAPRHVNIHIHTAVGTRVTNGEGVQGERVNGPGSGDSGQTRVLPMRNVFATAAPSRPPVSASGASQPGVSVTQPPPDSVPLSNVVADVNSRIRDLVDSMQRENQTPAGGQSESSTVHDTSVGGAGERPSVSGCMHGREDQKLQPQRHQETASAVNSEEVPSSSAQDCTSEDATLNTADDNPENTTVVPLGLGLGGLQPKRRSRQPKSQARSGEGGTSSAVAPLSQNQQVLQSLANRTNANSLSSRQLAPAPEQTVESAPLGLQGADGETDVASAMSQVLHSPALNGLLAGVSQQAGIGSPDVLRNMLGQLSQSPAMRNTVNQIAQQVDNQDLGNMFSGLGGGQGGGFDLSRMIQQMMPIVSQALGGGQTSTQSGPNEASEPPRIERSSRDVDTNNQNSQIDLQHVAQRIQLQNPPEEIFRSMVESAVSLYGSGTGAEDLLDELCHEDGLASEFMQALRHDISQRLQGES